MERKRKTKGWGDGKAEEMDASMNKGGEKGEEVEEKK